MKTKKIRKRLLAVILAVFTALFLCACSKDTGGSDRDNKRDKDKQENTGGISDWFGGKDKETTQDGGQDSTDGNGNSGNNGDGNGNGSYGDGSGDNSGNGNGSGDNGGNGDNSGYGDGNGNGGTSSDGKMTAVAREGMKQAVFYNNNSQYNIWFYIAWDEDGSNMRIVFFGDGNEGTVPFTTMDEQYYYGSADGDFMVNGKKCNGLELKLDKDYVAYMHLDIISGDEEFPGGYDGEVEISPMPSKYKGIFAKYYLDPIMYLDGDDYRLTATISGNEDKEPYVVENIFYSRDIWSDDEPFEVRNLRRYTDNMGIDEYFGIAQDYYDESDRVLTLGWYRCDKNGNRDARVDELSTYYYRFNDHIAPADYVNEDAKGPWGAIEYDAADTFLVPATDDYIVVRRKETIGVYDDRTQEYNAYDTDIYELHSFDGVGKYVQHIKKMIFPSSKAAEGYNGYMGSYYNLTVKDNIVYEVSDKFSSDYGKMKTIVDNVGGETTYSGTFYDGVHYYRKKDTNAYLHDETYISVLPDILTLEDHKNIIARCGTYSINDDDYESFELCFNLDYYYVCVVDKNVLEDVWMYDYGRDVKFDEKGFYCYMEVGYEENKVNIVIRADYDVDAINVVYYVFPHDTDISDYSMEGLTPDKVVEKTYPYKSKEFQH